MTKEEHIEFWVKSASIDLPVLEHLYEKGDYAWCLYIGQLIIEKMLKAHFVKKNNCNPPKTHDLVKLFSQTDIQKNSEIMLKLNRITEFNIEARYPDEKFNFIKKCNKEFTDKNINDIMELYKWLKSLI